MITSLSFSLYAYSVVGIRNTDSIAAHCHRASTRSRARFCSIWYWSKLLRFNYQDNQLYIDDQFSLHTSRLLQSPDIPCPCQTGHFQLIELLNSRSVSYQEVHNATVLLLFNRRNGGGLMLRKAIVWMKLAMSTLPWQDPKNKKKKRIHTRPSPISSKSKSRFYQGTQLT